MTTFITDIQPILLTALVGVLVAYARYVNSLKTRVAVLERTIEDLQKIVKEASKSKEPVLYIQGIYPTGKKGYFAVPLEDE